MRVVIGEGDFKQRDGAGIQRALDAVAKAGGGEVFVPAGTYVLLDALHLRTGVTLRGQRGQTLLTRPVSQTFPLKHYIGYGHCEFAIVDPSPLRVGMGVHVLDENAGGFYTTVGTITEQRGEWFFINRPAAHDYLPFRQGRVVTVFSLLEADGVTDASAHDLVLDGNVAESFRLNGCRGGGVFAINTGRLRLSGLEVRNYRGDAISFQQCYDVVVEDCEVHHNQGHGLHPGSGSVRYVFARNHIHHNGGDGLFYCLRTTHSLVEHNRIEHNRGVGVSVGERDTNHLLRHNVIVENAGVGIDFRVPVRQSGDHVQLLDNQIGPNCALPPAEHEIHFATGLADVWIIGNRIQPRRGSAINVSTGCTRICVTDNQIGTHPQTEDDVAGDRTAVVFDHAGPAPAVGPDKLPLDGARHLGISKLAPWRADF